MFYYPVFWNYMNYYAFTWMTYKLHHEESWFDMKIKEFQKDNPWIFDDTVCDEEVFFDCYNDLSSEDIEFLNITS